MKKAPKGVRVRSFKARFLQPDMCYKDEVLPVYFRATDGHFAIYPPQHIMMAARQLASKHADQNNHIWFHEETIETLRDDQIAPALRDLCYFYERLLKEEKREKVIAFTFQTEDDISFSRTPTLHLDYRVLWRVNGRLYRQDAPESPLSSTGVPEESVIIPWTAEHEAFFERMRGGLTSLIEALKMFFGQLQDDPGRAIAGMPLQAMLPPPVPPKEDET